METGRKYLLFLTKNYSHSILNPIFEELKKSANSKVYWFSTKSERFDISSDYWLESDDDVLNFGPDVIFAPGNIVPSHWSGLKVQLFHGIGEEKDGHYRMNGMFHMYCTPGPFVTNKFNNQSNGNFIVKETGWPKLDKVFTEDFPTDLFNSERPTILFAPTFSPKLTSAYDLFDDIKKIQGREYNWIIKFHELMNQNLINKYKDLASETFVISNDVDIIPHMAESDLLLTDTSSVAYEYLFFNKPIVTYRAKTRIDKGINIFDSADLEGSIIRGLSDPDEYSENRQFYISDLHPYQDGKSVRRVIDAVNDALNNGYKPLNKSSIKYLLNKWKTRNLVS